MAWITSRIRRLGYLTLRHPVRHLVRHLVRQPGSRAGRPSCAAERGLAQLGEALLHVLRDLPVALRRRLDPERPEQVGRGLPGVAALAEDGVPDWDVPMFHDAPDESSSAVDAHTDLERAMFRLPEEFRTVLLLAEVEGMPLEEISRVMACPVGTVKRRPP